MLTETTTYNHNLVMSTLENPMQLGSDTNNNVGKERNVKIFPRTGRQTNNMPPPLMRRKSPLMLL